jgi:hypothetical protein
VRNAYEVDAVREHGVVASLAGFPILLVFGVVWLAAGALSYAVPREHVPWAYLTLGLPAMPLAIALERRVGYLPPPAPDPLLPLTLQLLFVQILAFPAVLLVWDAAPAYVPVAFAAIVGAHFLPFKWVYATNIYLVLAVAVAVGPFFIALATGVRSMHYTGFFVGACLLTAAAALRAYARETWRRIEGRSDHRSVGRSAHEAAALQSRQSQDP